MTRQTKHTRQSSKGKYFWAGQGSFHTTKLVSGLVKEFNIQAHKKKPKNLLTIAKTIMNVKGVR